MQKRRRKNEREGFSENYTNASVRPKSFFQSKRISSFFYTKAQGMLIFLAFLVLCAIGAMVMCFSSANCTALLFQITKKG